MVFDKTTITVLLLVLALSAGCSKAQADHPQQVTESLVQSALLPQDQNGENKASPAETDTAEISMDKTSTAAAEKAEIIFPEATKADPYPWPVLTGGEFDMGEMNSECLDRMVKRMCYDLFLPMQTLENGDMASYIEDNPSTHLALRWPEYYIQQVRNAPWKQVLAITSVETAGGSAERENGKVRYHTICELRYNRKDPSVNGCNIEVTMEAAVTEGQIKIVGLKLQFDSRYHKLLSDLQAKAGAEGVSVQEIDRAFENLLKE